MKNIITAGAALMLTAATASWIDNSGQGIGAIFESGSYVELSYGSVMPSVSGSAAGGALNSDNIGGALKFDVILIPPENPNFSALENRYINSQQQWSVFGFWRPMSITKKFLSQLFSVYPLVRM